MKQENPVLRAEIPNERRGRLGHFDPPNGHGRPAQKKPIGFGS